MVMNRDAYVNANPDKEAHLKPDTTYVVVDGSSRHGLLTTPERQHAAG